MNGQPFQWKKGKVGFPVLVKPSNAEKNYQWNMNKKQEEADMRTLTISNLQIGVSEQNLRTLLEPFGGVEHIEMTKDTHGVPIGQCLVRFVSVSFAEKVVENLNGVELGGRPMEVMRLFDPIEAKKNKVVPSLMNTTSFLNNGGDSNVVTNPESTSWRLDAGRSGGLNAQSRSALMAKLAEKTGSNLSTPKKGKCGEKESLGTDGCTWKRHEVARILWWDGLIEAGWNATYDPDTPGHTNHTRGNIAVFKKAVDSLEKHMTPRCCGC